MEQGLSVLEQQILISDFADALPAWALVGLRVIACLFSQAASCLLMVFPLSPSKINSTIYIM